MGISGLWKLLQSTGQSWTFTQFTVSEGFEMNRRGTGVLHIGVDSSLMLNHAQWAAFHQKGCGLNMQAGENLPLQLLFYQINNQYVTVKNTSVAYNGQICQIHTFLTEQVKIQVDNGVAVCSLGIPTDKLAVALENPPNEYSSMVVEMFITQKCIIKNCKEQVAEQIHAALCKHWDTMDGDKYTGAYKLDEKTREVSGCPAQAQCVLDIKKAVKIHGKT
ncbi:hypothetical protein H0H87_012069, partial [Tephrocybe sp. NHM501043]